MTFYQPTAFFYLWVIPVIIMLYILKQRHQDFHVSSLYLWQETLRDIEANAPWQKLRKNLLMFLQIAAMLLFILALARPYLNAAGGKAQNVVIVLDTSFSMQATDVKPSRFEAAKKQASSYISNLSPGTLVTLVSIGNSAVIEENLSSDKNRLLETVNRLKVTNGTANYEDAVSLIESIVRQNPGTEVVLYGDKRLEVPGIDIKFSRISQGGDNYAVTSVSYAEVENSITVLSRIANFGVEDRVIPVSLYVDGKVFDARNVEVMAGETENVYWHGIPGQTTVIECRIDAEDALKGDNSAWTAVNISKTNRVMLVSQKNIFLEKVLSVMKGVELYRTGFEGADELKGYDLYIFDGFLPSRLPEDGNIMVFNPPSNGYFKVREEIVLQVGEEIILPEIRLTEHELLTHMEGQDFLVAKSKRLEVPKWGEILMESSEGAIAFAGSLDKSRIVVLGFDIHNSDLPLTPAFPIMMANMLEWLLAPGIENVESIYPGQEVEFNLYPKTEEATVTTPSGQRIKVAPPFPAPAFDATQETGIYTLEQKSADGSSIHRFAVNPPAAAESNLLEDNTGVPADAPDGPDTSNSGVETGFSLQVLLLWFALLLLCIEWWVYSNGI